MSRHDLGWEKANRRGKFERRAQQDALRQSQHRLKTRFDGAYRAVCSCLWIGESREDRAAAERDGEKHLEDS